MKYLSVSNEFNFKDQVPAGCSRVSSVIRNVIQESYESKERA